MTTITRIGFETPRDVKRIAEGGGKPIAFVLSGGERHESLYVGHRFDTAIYTQRNRVERLVGRLKKFRRVATRFEKRAVHFLAMVTLAAVLLWL